MTHDELLEKIKDSFTDVEKEME